MRMKNHGALEVNKNGEESNECEWLREYELVSEGKACLCAEGGGQHDTM